MPSVSLLLRRNTFFSMTSSVLRLVSNAVLFIVVARFYGPEIFGQFTAAHALGTIFILVADFGFDMLLTTEIAQDRKTTASFFPRLLGAKLAFSFAALVLMFVFPALYEMSDGARDLTYIFAFYMLFSALLNFLFALFKGFEELHHESVVTFSLNATLLVLLLILGIAGASIYLVAIAFVTSRLIGLVMAWGKSYRFVEEQRPVFDLQWIRSMWRQLAVFGFFFLFGNLYFIQDTILLSMFRGDHEVGIYQSVFRMIAITLAFPEVIVSAILPTLSRFYIIDEHKWHQVSMAANRILYYSGLLTGFVLVVGAEQIIDLVYGRGAFQEATPILRIFGCVVFVRYAVEIPAVMLTASKRQKIRMLLVIGATCVNLLLNLFAIPSLGATGAALVSLLTNVLVGVGYLIAVGDPLVHDWLSRPRIALLLLILSGGVIVIGIPEVPVWLIISAVTIVYLPTAYMLGFTAEERRLVFRPTST